METSIKVKERRGHDGFAKGVFAKLWTDGPPTCPKLREHSKGFSFITCLEGEKDILPRLDQILQGISIISFRNDEKGSSYNFMTNSTIKDGEDDFAV